MGNIFVVISYYKSTQPNVIPVTLSSHLSVVNKPFGTQHNCVCVAGVGGVGVVVRVSAEGAQSSETGSSKVPRTEFCRMNRMGQEEGAPDGGGKNM